MPAVEPPVSQKLQYLKLGLAVPPSATTVQVVPLPTRVLVPVGMPQYGIASAVPGPPGFGPKLVPGGSVP